MVSKQMKVLQGLAAEERQARIAELRKELLKQNSQVHSGANVANPGKLRQTKKTIARLLQLSQERRKA